jgi:hypothetical protein
MRQMVILMEAGISHGSYRDGLPMRRCLLPLWRFCFPGVNCYTSRRVEKGADSPDNTPTYYAVLTFKLIAFPAALRRGLSSVKLKKECVIWFTHTQGISRCRHSGISRVPNGGEAMSASQGLP